MIKDKSFLNVKRHAWKIVALSLCIYHYDIIMYSMQLLVCWSLRVIGTVSNRRPNNRNSTDGKQFGCDEQKFLFDVFRFFNSSSFLHTCLRCKWPRDFISSLPILVTLRSSLFYGLNVFMWAKLRHWTRIRLLYNARQLWGEPVLKDTQSENCTPRHCLSLNVAMLLTKSSLNSWWNSFCVIATSVIDCGGWRVRYDIHSYTRYLSNNFIFRLSYCICRCFRSQGAAEFTSDQINREYPLQILRYSSGPLHKIIWNTNGHDL